MVSCRRIVAVTSSLLLCAAFAACPASRNTVKPLGGLVIDCEPAQAQIFVDDQYLGTVSGLRGRPLKLRAGSHRLELRLHGYFAYYGEVTVAEGVLQRLQAKLRKQPF